MTPERVVAVVRLNSGEDVLAILLADKDDRLMVQHPHYIRMNPVNQTVAMIPYCALSDETFYEISKPQIIFTVTATEDISKKFLRMVDARDAIPSDDLEEEWDGYEDLSSKTIVSGNETKH